MPAACCVLAFGAGRYVRSTAGAGRRYHWRTLLSSKYCTLFVGNFRRIYSLTHMHHIDACMMIGASVQVYRCCFISCDMHAVVFTSPGNHSAVKASGQALNAPPPPPRLSISRLLLLSSLSAFSTVVYGILHGSRTRCSVHGSSVRLQVLVPRCCRDRSVRAA